MGRKIAIFTDAHGLLEPVEAVINDAKKRGITEIYSLGDNIGDGPNPAEVIELLEKENVVSVAGNAEYYITLGPAPFRSYLNEGRLKNVEWTRKELLRKGLIKNLEIMKPSLDLILGGKKIALVHFANDVRWDYNSHSTWTYQDSNYNSGQFYYTNSEESKRTVNDRSKLFIPSANGFKDAKLRPIFDGKTPYDYDTIIQGHVHYDIKRDLKYRGRYIPDNLDPRFTTVRGLAIGYMDAPKNQAYYIILEEQEDGYKVEEVYVPFDREKMIRSINNSDMPDNSTMIKFTR